MAKCVDSPRWGKGEAGHGVKYPVSGGNLTHLARTAARTCQEHNLNLQVTPWSRAPCPPETCLPLPLTACF